MKNQELEEEKSKVQSTNELKAAPSPSVVGFEKHLSEINYKLWDLQKQ
jgi:hypothetical protein